MDFLATERMKSIRCGLETFTCDRENISMNIDIAAYYAQVALPLTFLWFCLASSSVGQSLVSLDTLRWRSVWFTRSASSPCSSASMSWSCSILLLGRCTGLPNVLHCDLVSSVDEAGLETVVGMVLPSWDRMQTETIRRQTLTDSMFIRGRTIANVWKRLCVWELRLADIDVGDGAVSDLEMDSTYPYIYQPLWVTRSTNLWLGLPYSSHSYNCDWLINFYSM